MKFIPNVGEVRKTSFVNSYYPSNHSSSENSEMKNGVDSTTLRPWSWPVVGGIATSICALMPLTTSAEASSFVSDSNAVNQFDSLHKGVVSEIRFDTWISNIVPGATADSGQQLANFFKAMRLADRSAVWKILQDVKNVFGESINSLELEHNFDYDTGKNQLFVSVETGLSTKDILEKRMIFNKLILSDDSKKAASKYTITTFF